MDRLASFRLWMVVLGVLLISEALARAPGAVVWAPLAALGLAVGAVRIGVPRSVRAVLGQNDAWSSPGISASDLRVVGLHIAVIGATLGIFSLVMWVVGLVSLVTPTVPVALLGVLVWHTSRATYGSAYSACVVGSAFLCLLSIGEIIWLL
jgi:hypothetical protein